MNPDDIVIPWYAISVVIPWYAISVVNHILPQCDYIIAHIFQVLPTFWILVQTLQTLGPVLTCLLQE